MTVKAYPLQPNNKKIFIEEKVHRSKETINEDKPVCIGRNSFLLNSHQTWTPLLLSGHPHSTPSIFFADSEKFRIRLL